MRRSDRSAVRALLLTGAILATFTRSWPVCAAETLMQREPRDLPDYRKEIEMLFGSSESGRMRKALKLLDEMEAPAREDGEWTLYVQWRRACCGYLLGNATQAQEMLEKALENAKKLPSASGLLFFVHRDLGEFYLRSHRVIQAKKHIQEAIKRANQADKEPLQFKTERFKISEVEKLFLGLLKAECLVKQAENEAAEKELSWLAGRINANLKAANWELQSPEWENLAVRCDMELAELDRRRFDSIRAIKRLEWCQDRLKLCANQFPTVALSHFRELQLQCHINLANNYWKLARFDEAREQLDLAEEIPGIDNDYTRWDLAHTRTALETEKLEALFEKNRDDPNILKQLDALEKDAKRAIDYSRKLRQEPNYITAVSLHSLALIHELSARVHEWRNAQKASVARYQLAKRLCEQSIELMQQLLEADHDMLLQIRRCRARMNCKLGDLETARNEATEALQLFSNRRGKEHVDCGLFHHLLLEIEARTGDANAAARHAEAHRRLAAESMLHYLRDMTASGQIRFFRMWDDPGLHASLRLGLAHESLGDRSAEWLFNGKAKIAEVMAHLNQQERDSEYYPKLQQSIRRQGYLLYGCPEAAPATVQRELLEEESKKRALATQRRMAEVPQQWYTFAEVRKRLTSDDVYIDVFCLARDERSQRAYYAWIVTAAKPTQVVCLGEAAEIDKLVLAFLRQQNPRLIEQDGPIEAEKKLHQDCLKPLSRLLLKNILPLAAGKKRWIVSPDGPLWNLPWGALLLPPDEKTYAVEKITLSYVIAGRDLLEPPALKNQPDKPWVLADPDVDRAPAAEGWRRREKFLLPRLPDSHTEGKEVVGRLKQLFQVDLQLQDDRTTKEDFLRLTKPPRIVYLATHSFSALPTKVAVDDPLLCCAIAFAGCNYIPEGKNDHTDSLPGWMTAAEVLRVDLHGTELVVLSACESGTGVVQNGQSPADLRHAFHLAGARAVVSTLWPVVDRESRDLMIPFITSLSQKAMTKKAQALCEAQKAQIEALRKKDHHGHPFLWAAFTLSGLETHAPVESSRRSPGKP